MDEQNSDWKEPKKGATADQVLSNVQLSGKHFFITGANQGIGKLFHYGVCFS